MSFHELSDFGRSLCEFWTLLLCLVAIVESVASVSVKRYRYVLISAVLFAVAFFLWQVLFNLHRFGWTEQAAAVSIRMGAYPWLLWLVVLIVLTIGSAVLVVRTIRYTQTYITPLAIKNFTDKVNCGICYWQDNGHVIFANACMNRLCIELTDTPLVNGNLFRKAICDSIQPIGDMVWKFDCHDMVYAGQPLHEMIAWDVTEIHAKTQEIKHDTVELSRLNEELKAYSAKIEDTIRRQEILQAKVNIHDEMNKLMLSTVAADIENNDEMNRIFALWERDALLLCLEEDEKRNAGAESQLSELANTLGIRLVWEPTQTEILSQEQRELFFIAAREAIVNAAKHGEVKEIRIALKESEREICCLFENAGASPAGEVRFTGGLANLDLLAKEHNAFISAEIGDSFTLSLVFLKSLEGGA